MTRAATSAPSAATRGNRSSVSIKTLPLASALYVRLRHHPAAGALIPSVALAVINSLPARYGTGRRDVCLIYPAPWGDATKARFGIHSIPDIHSARTSDHRMLEQGELRWIVSPSEHASMR